MTNGRRRPTSKRSGAPRPQTRRPPGSARKPAARTAPAPRTSEESALRTAVAERSRGLVVWLSRVPQYLVPGAMVALMVVGLAAPVAVALPALLLIIAFIGWLAFLSWPILQDGQRTIRLVAIGIVVLAAVGRLAGRF